MKCSFLIKTKHFIFVFNIFDLTFRFCRWTSPGDEGSGGDDDDVGYNPPLPALINGRWERRIDKIFVDDIVVVVVVDFIR
jgi:hypothetical protein